MCTLLFNVNGGFLVETPRWGVYLGTLAGIGRSCDRIEEDVSPTRLYEMLGGVVGWHRPPWLLLHFKLYMAQWGRTLNGGQFHGWLCPSPNTSRGFPAGGSCPVVFW
jgi:hypothetical protein